MTDAAVRAYSCYSDIDQKKTVYIHSYFFQLRAGHTYRFSFPVSKSDVPEEDKSIYIILQGNGHVLIDNVEFIPTPAVQSTQKI